jgi:hypothetical protein
MFQKVKKERLAKETQAQRVKIIGTRAGVMAQEDPLSPPFEDSDAPTEAANFGGMLAGIGVEVSRMAVEATGTTVIAGGVAKGEAVTERIVE